MKKSAFSLIEMMFAIIIIAIIASFAIPKLMGSKDDATVSTIKQDIQTITSSVQTYYMVNGKIEKISDSVILNSSIWDISDLSVTYKEDDKQCVNIKIEDKQLKISIDKTAGDICQKIYDEGIRSNSIDLK
jgi:general secretion pathway protein G